MEEGYSSKAIRAFNIVMFLFTGVFVFLFSFLTGKSDDQTIRNTVVSLLISAVVIFMLQDDRKRGEKSFSFDNYFRRHRFFIAYMVMVVMSCIFSLMPAMLWPYMSIFVILAYLSNHDIGLTAGIGFTAISVMLLPYASYSDLLMHALAGVVALALFKDPDREKGIALPMFVSLMMQAVLLSAFGILFEESRLSAQLLVMPFLNLMVNMVILFAFMNFVSVYIIGKSNDEALSDTDETDRIEGNEAGNPEESGNIRARDTEEKSSLRDDYTGDTDDYHEDDEVNEVEPLSHEETVEMIRNLLDKYDYVPLNEREKYTSDSDDDDSEDKAENEKEAEPESEEANDEEQQDKDAPDSDKVNEEHEDKKQSETLEEQKENPPVAKKRRGRKPKKAEPSAELTKASENAEQEKTAEVKKKRGRKPKKVEPKNDAIS